jgi:hypothetical protein
MPVRRVHRLAGPERRLMHLELGERRGRRIDDRADATGRGGADAAAVARKDGGAERGR